jgi:putative nucleotidyltransferase with HDIG domain
MTHSPAPTTPFGFPLTQTISADRPGVLLRLLDAARKNTVLYQIGHPQVAQSLNELQAGLSVILKARPSVRFDVFEDAFFLGNRILLEESLHASALLEQLMAQRVGSVEFVQGVSVAEAARFVEILVAASGGGPAVGDAVANANLPHIKTGPPRAQSTDELKEAVIAPRELYRIGLRTMDALNYQAVQGSPLNLRNARLLANSMVKVILQDRNALLGVAALYQHDEDTCHHSVNVAVLSLMLGLRMSLEEATLPALGTAALLHDVGKMRIPRSLLGKYGRLTATERSVLERHTIHGAALVQHLRGLSQTAMLVALEHHLNYDLSGYPRLPQTQHQHLFTQVVAIGDFFDASTSARRSDRKSLLPDQAVHEIVAGAGTRFEPTLAKLFFHSVGGYPVGSVVRLSSGEIAIVYRTAEGHPLRPQLKMVRDAQGAAVEPIPVELSQNGRRILHSIDPIKASIDLAAYL